MASAKSETNKPEDTDSADVSTPENDKLDTTTSVSSDMSGKRIKAIPGLGGTTVIISDKDFAANGIAHKTVIFKLRVSKFTLQVGTEISEEAANFLVESRPSSYQFVN